LHRKEKRPEKRFGDHANRLAREKSNALVFLGNSGPLCGRRKHGSGHTGNLFSHQCAANPERKREVFRGAKKKVWAGLSRGLCRGQHEFLGAALSSAGLFASILGAFLTYAARKNGQATRDLIRTMEERMTKHFSELFERMDKRSDERHREVIQAISPDPTLIGPRNRP